MTSLQLPTTLQETMHADRSSWRKCKSSQYGLSFVLDDLMVTAILCVFNLRYIRISLHTNKDGKIPVKK